MLYRITDCTLAIGGENLLEHFDFEIKGRERIAITGPNGSGKTTLLNILSALDRQTAGTVYLQGKEIGQAPEEERELLRRQDMGFIFQAVALIPVMNAYENVDFGLRLAGVNDDRDARVRECLELVGLKNRMKHMPGEMSGGEQQRVAIARAIAHRPKVIFADEPTGALDTNTGLAVMHLFKELIEKEGITIVMTTHDTNLMELGDVVYEMEDGMIGR